MSTEWDELSRLVGELCDGWHERIEYSVRVQTHDRWCQEIQRGMTVPQLRHLTCVCPEVIERRAETREQAPLLTQLVASMYHDPTPTADDNGGGGGGKPKSKPPGNLVRPELLLWNLAGKVEEIYAGWVGPGLSSRIEDITPNLRTLVDVAEARLADEVGTAVHIIGSIVRKIRSNLGYESDFKLFAETVCGSCGGALRVDVDRPTDVRCAGTPARPPCGETYPWETWGQLLAAGPVLADTKTAVACMGVTRSTLYSWASRGHVTRYGGSGRDEARWDLDELKTYRESALDKRGKRTAR